MKRFRVVNDDIDTWLCQECLDNPNNNFGVDVDIIDTDNDDFDEGCLECGNMHTTKLWLKE